MRAVYPVKLEEQQDEKILVSFPDVPEALTEGETESEAMAEAVDCLVAALAGYISQGHHIPQASPAEVSDQAVVLPPLVADGPPSGEHREQRCYDAPAGVPARHGRFR